MASSADSKSTSSGRIYWVGAAAITLAAVWLHFTFLTHAGGLWRDEVNLINLAELPAGVGLRQDSFPILMPLLVRGWAGVGFGGTDLGLRCLAMLVGLGLLGAFWAVAWNTRRAPPVLALAFMALNSTALVYGDSLRAYGLGSLLIVLTFGTAWWFSAKPSVGRFVCFTALAVAGVQTLFHNSVLIGAICVGASVVCARRKAWRGAALCLAAGLVAAVSLLPYLPNFVSALEPSAGWRTGFRPQFTWLDVRVATGFPLERYVFVWAVFVVGAILSGAVALLPAWRSKLASQRPAPSEPTASAQAEQAFGPSQGRQRENLPLFAATTLVTAVAGFFGFLWFARLGTQPWYFLPVMALMAACFDAALPPVHRYVRAALLGFALVTALLAFPLARISAQSRLTNVDLLARWLMTEAAPEDFVVVSPWFLGISFERYFKGQTPWSTLPPLADHRFHRFDLVSAQLGRKEAIDPVLDRISATLRAGRRVWLVGWVEVPPPGATPPPDLPRPPLKGSGWSQTPYTINWNDKIANYLSAHSLEFDLVKVSSNGDVNPNEDLKLVRVRGWK